MERQKTYTAFQGHTLFASGPADKVLGKLKSEFDRDPTSRLLIFDDETGQQVDFDLRGELSEVLKRNAFEPTRSGPGRPKLGVVAREVTLLPRHWDWLERQPNGASAALRRLVEEAQRRDPEKQNTREITYATGRFLSAIAGNFPGYEEALRALYAGDGNRFGELTAEWPADVRSHAMHLMQGNF